MKKLQLFVLSVLFTVSVLVPKLAQSLEDTITPAPQKKLSAIQLQKVTDDTLGAILGTGNNALLKIDMDLKSLKEPVEHDFLEVPVRLYLTDFASNPTSHKPIQLSIKVDCEQTPLVYVLPEKPSSFESYNHFSDWLNRAYFTYENRIAYDFHVDVNQVAPSLVEQLYVVASDGYRFAGTYAIHNTRIMPDDCFPKVSYVSQRGNAKTTTATLGGNIYLNKKPYPIEDHTQVFPHQMVEEIVFKRDVTKKFYTNKWLSQSEATVKQTYKEFPDFQVNGWPDAPSNTYNIVKQKHDDLEEIVHMACWDGNTGEEVNILDGKIYFIVCEAATKYIDGSEFLESVVKDETGNFYTMRFRYSETENKKRKKVANILNEKEIEKLAKKEAKKPEKEELTQQLEAMQKEITGVKAELQEIKLQEAEQRKKQQWISKLDSRITDSIEYIMKLYSTRSLGELFKVLSALEMRNGTSENQKNITATTKEEAFDPRIAAIDPHITTAITKIKSLCEKGHAKRNLQNDYIEKECCSIQTEIFQEIKSIRGIIKEDLLESMKIYKDIQGLMHPVWFIKIPDFTS